MHELLGEDGRSRSHHRNLEGARESPRRDSVEAGCAPQRKIWGIQKDSFDKWIFPRELALIPLKGQASTTTRSEALQRISNRKECPSLLECESGVTQDYFKRICGTRGYVRCHHYARRMGELNAPMAWLQRLAIIDAVKKAEDQQPQGSIAVK